jgi:hypothetical protein
MRTALFRRRPGRIDSNQCRAGNGRAQIIIPETWEPAMSAQEKHLSIVASLRGWWQNRRRATAAALAPMPTAIEEPAPPAACLYDGSLLFRCMEMLQIDRDELASDDPLLFRELQGRCALCRDKAECVHAQARTFEDADWDRWRDYCPNSSTLTTIGAVQNCARAAQYLKMPRSDASPDLG